MTNTLLLTSEKALDLNADIKLFNALVAMVADLKKLIVGQPPSVTTAEALLEKIAKDMNSQTIADAFALAGLTPQLALIKAFVAKVKTAENKIPEEYKALLKPLSAFPEHDDSDNLTWKIASSGDPVVSGQGYSLKLAGQASLLLDAGASRPGATGAAKRLLLQAGGAVSAGAEASIPYAFGLGSGKASASETVTLAYYYAPKGDPLYALAVAERVAQLPNPFDLGEIWRRMHGGEDADLDAITYAFGGAASASFEVTFAGGRGLGSKVSLDAGVKVSVQASLKSDYHLTLLRTDTGISAAMSRARVKEGDFNGGLDLTVDISKLTQPVASAVKRAVGDWDKALDSIKDFLSPGELLRNKGLGLLDKAAADLISNATLRAAVVADLKGALGVGDVIDSKVAEWLSGQISGALNQGQVLIDGQADKALDRVMAIVTKALPALSSHDAEVRALVKTQIAALEKKLRDALDAQLDTSAAAAKLKDALKKAGVSVDGWVADVDNVLKPVRDLLKHCDTLFHDILNVAEQAAKKKVTARLYREEQRLSGQTIEISGDFSNADAPAQEVFAALTWGRVKALAGLIDGTSTAAGFSLNRNASSIERYSQFRSAEGAEVAFINPLLNASVVAKGEARIKLDGNGDIHVATEAELTKSLLTWFNRKEVSFAHAYKAVQAAASQDADAGLPRVPPTMDLGIGALYAEKSLDRDDVKRFIDGLASVKLVKSDVLDRALAVYDTWKAAAPGGKVSGELSATLRIKGDRLLALIDPNGMSDRRLVASAIATATAPNTRLIDAARYQSGSDMAVDQWGNNTPRPTDLVDRTLNYARGYEDTDHDIHYDFEEKVPNVVPRHDGQIMDQPFHEAILDDFFYHAFLFKCLVLLVRTMGDIYRARAAKPGGEGWDEDEYAKQDRVLLACSERWLTVFDSLLHVGRADVTRTTLTFMRIMMDLTGMGTATPGALILNMTWKKPNGEPEVVSFG